jgi:hypothetical protein
MFFLAPIFALDGGQQLIIETLNSHGFTEHRRYSVRAATAWQKR